MRRQSVEIKKLRLVMIFGLLYEYLQMLDTSRNPHLRLAL